MSNIPATVNIGISNLLANIDTYRYNPSNIQKVVLTHLENITEGKVNLVDPSNPFIFLLESASVLTSAFITANEQTERKIHANLALSTKDLIDHFSDKDFAGRFAQPGKASFQFMIPKNDIFQYGVEDVNNKYFKLTIPRNTEVTVDGVTFSLQYPIDIKRFYNDVIQISYNNDIISPLQDLTTNIIDYTWRTASDYTQQLLFSIPLYQFKILTTEIPVSSSTYFSKDIEFQDSFYYARIYFKSNQTNNLWKEITVTESEQVYDIKKPTAVIRVGDNILNVIIPQFYINNGNIDGSVRVDIYCTKGDSSLNMSGYQLDSFTTTLRSIDVKRDSDIYTVAMSKTNYFAFSADTIVGGRNELPFNLLRESVIANSLGDRNLPITNLQLFSFVNDLGYDIVTNVDVVTNRIFLAAKDLPIPQDSVVPPSNSSIQTLVVNLEYLKTIEGVMVNDQRMTLPASMLYQDVNGVVSPFTNSRLNSIKVLGNEEFVKELNNIDLLYSPFYHVLDNTSSQFKVRVYHLDDPTISGLNFITQNATGGVIVNTADFSFIRVENGWRLRILTKSDDNFKALPDTSIFCQLSYIPVGETSRASINGVMYAKDPTTNERAFEFYINTNLDIDENDNITFTNFNMFSNQTWNSNSPLSNQFDIIYGIIKPRIGFVSDQAQNKLNSFMLPNNSVAITNETIDLGFGKTLHNLWSQSRSAYNTADYKRYTDNIPLLYVENIYEVDPVTGSSLLFDANGNGYFNILHNQGDPVLDADGNPVYLHKVGDIMLDTNGLPIPYDAEKVLRHIDMLFLDAKYKYVNDALTLKYNEYCRDTLVDWIVNDLGNISTLLIEQSKIFFHPKTSMGTIKVKADNGGIVTIQSNQSFKVDIYVSESTYNNLDLRNQLSLTTITTLRDAMKLKVINISDIVATLKQLYGSEATSVRIKGLGGDKDYETVTIQSDRDSLGLKKILVRNSDDSISLIEDITIGFIKI